MTLPAPSPTPPPPPGLEPPRWRKLWNTLQPAVFWAPFALLSSVVWPALFVPAILALLVVIFWPRHYRNLAAADLARGRFGMARRRLERARRVARCCLRPADYRAASLRLGDLLRRLDRPEAAAAMYAGALPWQRYGEASRRLQAILLNNAGVAWREARRYLEAEAYLMAAVAQWRRLPPTDPSHPVALENLAVLYADLGQREKRLATLRGALQAWDAIPEAEPRRRLQCCAELARTLPAEGDDAEAEALWRRILNSQERAHGGDAPECLEPLRRLMIICDRHARRGEHVEWFERWLACRQAQPQAAASDIAEARLQHAERLLGWGEVSQARRMAEALLQELPLEARRQRAWALHLRAQVHLASGQPDAAEADAQIALGLLHGEPGAGTRQLELMVLLGDASHGRNQLGEAHRQYETALALLHANLGDDHPWIAAVRQKLDSLDAPQPGVWVN